MLHSLSGKMSKQEEQVDSETTTYKPAPMQPVILGVTIFVFLIPAFFVAMALLSTKDALIWLSPAAFTCVVILGCAQYRPFGFKITSDSVRIVKGWPFTTIVIPISEIQSVRRYKFTWMTIRAFGVGGLFSAGGYFWDRQIGSFYAAITDQSRAALVKARKNYIISPADPDAFIATLESRIGGSASA